MVTLQRLPTFHYFVYMSMDSSTAGIPSNSSHILSYKSHNTYLIDCRPVARGCDAPPNLPKGPLLASKWAKNGVFVGWLGVVRFKKLTFGSKRSTFGGSRTTQMIIDLKVFVFERNKNTYKMSPNLLQQVINF